MSIEVEGSLGSWKTSAIVTTMMPILIALSVLQMGSGLVLDTFAETYLGNPTLLIMVPVMIAMGGNMGSILSSRLSTRLHLGILSFEPTDPDLLRNVVAILGLSATIFTALGVVTYGVGFWFYARPLPLVDLLVISLTSGSLLAGIAIVVSIGATWLSYRWGLDPDDTTIPVVTNVCDICGLIILSGVAIVVL